MGGTMTRPLGVASGLLVGLPSFGFQIAEPPKSALERRGLYHADIHGKFVSAAGDAVAGVHVQLNAGRVRSLPLADAVTGADGAFLLRNVNSAYMPDLRWYPPDGWMRGGAALLGESGTEIDAGTIRLQPDTVIRVSVEIVGGPPRGPRDREPTVVLQGKGQLGPRIVGEKLGAFQILRQIPFEDGNWEISLFANNKSEYYRAPLHVQRGRRDEVFVLRLMRDTLKSQNQYSSEGKLEVSEMILPPVPAERDFMAAGRVLAPDGSVIEGAIVGVNDFALRRTSPRWVVSDGQGRFQLTYRGTSCAGPSVSHGDSDFWFFPYDPGAAKVTCDEEWKDPRDLVMPTATRLAPRIEGLDSASVQLFWWHDSFGWQKFSSLHPWVSVGGFGETQVKAEAEGFLPLVRSVDHPSLDRTKKEQPPAETPVAFLFDRGLQRELLVLANGKALFGATVDLELIEDLEKDQRRSLKTYKTAADGRIRLSGGGDQTVEAFVYADGFEPSRAIWNPGSVLTFDLRPRSATFSFAPNPSLSAARVRETNSPQAARTVKLGASAAEARVAPGTYDITVYTERGQVSSYQRVAIAPGETRTVEETADQRPRLTVRYPESGWHAAISESAPRGGATGWAVMISVGNSLTFSDVPATLERESAREAVFLLSRAGKVHVEMRRASQTLSLWRDIEMRPGESAAIEVPSQEATLKGSMRSYDGGLGFPLREWSALSMLMSAIQ
jgi:hypothetical protein